MPINVKRQFAGVGLASGGGVFAPAPVPSGDLETTRALGGAQMRRFDALADAIDAETEALVEEAEADAAIGQGVRVGARQIAGVFEEVEERRRQSRNRHNAATVRAQFLEDAAAAVPRAYAESDPAGTDMLELVRTGLAKRKDELLSSLQIDSQEQRAALERQLDFVADRAVLAARRASVQKDTQFMRGELEKRLEAYGNQALQFRDATQQHLVGVAISDIRDAVGDGLLSPEAGERKIAAFRTGVLRGVLETDAPGDPLSAQARLTSGGYEHLFASESERAAAERKIGRALSTQRVFDSAKLDGAVEAHLANLRETGKGNPALRALVAKLSPDAMDAFDQKTERARAYFLTLDQIRYLPAEQAEMVIRETEPQPGAGAAASEQAQRRIALHLAAKEAWQTRQRALADDPYGYAAQHPQVKTRADNIALQKALGVARPLEMSKAEVAELRGNLERATPEEMAELLGQAGSEFSQTGIDQVWAALRDERPALAFAVRRIKSMPEVSKDVLEGIAALAQNSALRPDAAAMAARAEEVFGDAFEHDPVTGKLAFEAAVAIYARNAPDATAPFDAAIFDAALNRAAGAAMDAAGNVKGGLADHRGRKVVLPPGVDDPGVVVGNLTLEALETYGGGRPVDADGQPLAPEDIRARGRLVPAGDGRYMIELDEPERPGTGEAEGLDALAGGEGDDTLIGGAGEDELRELTDALKAAGLDFGLPVDGVAGSIEDLDEAAPGTPEEVQVAILSKLLGRLGLRASATASGRAILRALNRTKGRPGRPERDELGDLVGNVGRNTLTDAILNLFREREGALEDESLKDDDGETALRETIETLDPTVPEDRSDEEFSESGRTTIAPRRIAEGPERYKTVGNHIYVQFEDGSIDFGEIPEEAVPSIGLPAGPIRLPRGFHYPDETGSGPGVGWGDVHIEAGHGGEIRNHVIEGAQVYQSGADLVSDVAENFHQIWSTDKSDRLILVKRNGHAFTAIVEISREAMGDIYDVVSGGIRSSDYPQRRGRKLLWERKP